MNKYLISICVATCGDRIENLSTWIFDPRIMYLIFWQSDKHTVQRVVFPQNVRLFKVYFKGVTLSRNMAIQKCDTEWLWFMDDDVSIPISSINNLLLLLPLHRPTDVLIASVDFGISALNKVFVRDSISKFSIFSIGTIQIICNAETARSSQSLFPTNMGAGSQYPVCDEPIFLFRLMKNAQVKLCSASSVVVTHPPLSSGLNFRGRYYLTSRAMLFREVFGIPLCFLVSLIFFLKHAFKIRSHFIFLFFYRKPL